MITTSTELKVWVLCAHNKQTHKADMMQKKNKWMPRARRQQCILSKVDFSVDMNCDSKANKCLMGPMEFKATKNQNNKQNLKLDMNTDLPTPKYFCLYSAQRMSVCSDFLLDFFFFFFFADTPPISRNEAVSKVNFSIIHLVRTVCELTFSIITDVLHLDDFILFTSAKVVLNRRPQNTFSKNNVPCVLR